MTKIALVARDWTNYVNWKDIRDMLGDWRLKIRVIVTITIDFNFARDLVAQGIAFFLNLLLNVLLFIFGVVAVFIVALISLLAQVLAPILKPLFRTWDKLSRRDLGIDIYSEGTIYRGLSDLLWGSLPGWAGNMIGNMWKPVEKIYAEIPGALKALESIRAYLASTVFVIFLQHLGVGGPIVSAVRSVVEFVQKWIGEIQKWLDNLEEWIKTKLGVFWWVVEEYVTGIFDELQYALSELKRKYVDPLQACIDEYNRITTLWIDEKGNIASGFFRYVGTTAFTGIVNSIAKAYEVSDNLSKLLESYRARQELEKKRVDDNEDTLGVMFKSTLTDEELIKLQASPVMRDINRTTKLIEDYVAGKKVPQGNDIDKTEEEISGTVG